MGGTPTTPPTGITRDGPPGSPWERHYCPTTCPPPPPMVGARRTTSTGELSTVDSSSRPRRPARYGYSNGWRERSAHHSARVCPIGSANRLDLVRCRRRGGFWVLVRTAVAAGRETRQRTAG